jgi:hypothetical protein
MSNTLSSLKPASIKSPTSVNPFARALAETEQSFNKAPQLDSQNHNIFSDALSKTGGNFDFNQPSRSTNYLEQQQQLEKQRKQEMLRRKLHDQVNPVHTTELFNSREKRVKEEIDKLRAELKMLVKEVGQLNKSVEITLMTEVVHPGQSGTYYISFFQQLRSFIVLLRQHVRSANTWATQMHTKGQKKKNRKATTGMSIAGLAHEKTSTVQNMQHHERSTAYSGG